MKIKQISLWLVGATLMAGAVSSCTESKYENEAKSKAVKYLNG